MSTETAVPVDDVTVRAEAQRILAQTAAKHNMSVDDIPAEAVDRALEEARKRLERAAEDAANPYKGLYLQERQQREIAENTLQSIQTQGQKHSGAVAGPPLSAEQARRRAGDLQWLHKMTDSQKIQALGVDPSQYTAKEAAKIFSRDADPKLGSDLHKADPSRYKILREVAKAVGVYAA